MPNKNLKNFFFLLQKKIIIFLNKLFASKHNFLINIDNDTPQKHQIVGPRTVHLLAHSQHQVEQHADIRCRERVARRRRQRRHHRHVLPRLKRYRQRSQSVLEQVTLYFSNIRNIHDVYEKTNATV